MQEGLLLTALLAGFFGSSHCFGMCGPIVVLLEAPRSGAWLRRIAGNAGRISFYVLLGTIAGALGLVLTKMSGLQSALNILRVVAGILIIVIGIECWLGTLFDHAVTLTDQLKNRLNTSVTKSRCCHWMSITATGIVS